MRRFQAGEVPIFLISLKAGGTGLTLTRADTVIHYDPWWNPAVENQATDRAHRIGQDKTVFVYKLIATGRSRRRWSSCRARSRPWSTACCPAPPPASASPRTTSRPCSRRCRTERGPTARRVSTLWLRAMPALFVLLWSTGFIGARLGMPHAEPMTFLTLRFALTAAVLALAALRGGRHGRAGRPSGAISPRPGS